VKQTLSRPNIRYAQKKAASVRRLHRTSLPIQEINSVRDPRVPATILAGIVALDGNLARSNRDLLSNATDREMIHFGCSLKGKVYFRLENIHPWQANATPYQLAVSEDSNELVNFFVNLVAALQKVGTVVAMDTAAYLK
jgi:hypothetical protein